MELACQVTVEELLPKWFITFRLQVAWKAERLTPVSRAMAGVGRYVIKSTDKPEKASGVPRLSVRNVLGRPCMLHGYIHLTALGRNHNVACRSRLSIRNRSINRPSPWILA